MTVTNNYQTGGSGASPLTTQGDLYGHSASADARVPAGTDGQALVADSSQAAGVGYDWLATPHLHNSWLSLAHMGFGVIASLDTVSIAANTLILMPFRFPRPAMITLANLPVLGASTSGSLRIGLYQLTGQGSATLIATFGTVSTAAVTSVQLSSLSVNCPASIIALAYLADQSFTTRGTRGAYGLGVSGSNAMVTPFQCLTTSQTYGALPSSVTGLAATMTETPTVVLNASPL